MLTAITTDPVVLRKKAQQKRKDTGDERWRAPVEKSNKSFLRTVGYSLLRPFEILLFEPMALILNLYSAILLGILYLFFGAFPFVFEGAFGFDLWQTGLAFLGLLLGMLAGAMSSGAWQKVRMRLIEKNEAATGAAGKSEPEFRLPSVIVGSVFVTAGLFWFAWTTFSWVHWILPIIGAAIFGIGVSLFLWLLFAARVSRETETGTGTGTGHAATTNADEGANLAKDATVEAHCSRPRPVLGLPVEGHARYQARQTQYQPVQYARNSPGTRSSCLPSVTYASSSESNEDPSCLWHPLSLAVAQSPRTSVPQWEDTQRIPSQPTDPFL